MNFKFVFPLALFFCLEAVAGSLICDRNAPFGCSEFLPDMEDGLIKTDIRIEHVFVPKGFDTNDLAKVIVFGWTSTCFQSPQAMGQRDGSKIRITAQAVKSPGRICLPMAVPYIATANLGFLEKGGFDVQIQNQDGAFVDASLLQIEEAKTDQLDNFIYANVERVSQNDDGKKLILSGRNPSGCFELDRIESFFNGKDTYAVLPIMKQVKEECPHKMVPFRYEIDIDKANRATKMLWHVRSLLGKSMNIMRDEQNVFYYQ